MDVKIEAVSGSRSLDSLKLVVESQPLNFEEVRGSPAVGTKVLGELLSLELAAVSVSSLSLLLQAVQFWKSQRPGRTITIEEGGVTVEISDLSQEQAIEAIKRVASESGPAAVLMQVSE